MSTKGVLVGTFVPKNKVLAFVEGIHNTCRISIDRIFVYEIETNEKEYLVTFKTSDRNDFKNRLSGSIVMHTKNGCLFSINALNKLIDSEKGDENIKNSEFSVDWEKYRGKLITVTNGKLCVSNISKIEDKSIFFK